MRTTKSRGVRAAHDHAQCVQQALTKAEQVCARHGARLTELRRRVLELTWNSHRAVKAYDLLEHLGDGKQAAKPPTVYRALEFLQGLGLIHKLESLNAYVGCPDPEGRHPTQFLICRSCGLIQELELPALGVTVGQEARRHGFQVERQLVEVHGLCRSCHRAT